MHDTTVYVIGHRSRTIYSYRLDKDKWKKHSECSHVNPGLVIINDLLTTVGGKEGDRPTNKLCSWKGTKWVEMFPPMKTPREGPAVVHYGNYIITMGDDYEESVELLHIPSLLWSAVTSLPRPLRDITATLCNNDIIIMDYMGYAYTISVTSLISATQLEGSSTQWVSLPQCPVEGYWPGPTLSSLSGQCLVVSRHGIFQLQDRQWVRIGHMSVPMYYCIACVVCDQMVVVGGTHDYSTSTDAVRVVVIM